MRKPSIALILPPLVRTYGDRTWEMRSEPVDELVLTILSQNTSDTNSRRAFLSLKDKYPSWGLAAAADAGSIAGAIRSGGLADVKARYIRGALQALQQRAPGMELRFLAGMPVRQAREWLAALPGVGMKTASCVLLFSLGLPAFPVDTHVFRVGKRLRLIGGKMGPDAAHIEMERITPGKDIYRCHVLLIEHGRKTCRAQRPLCNSCCLSPLCPGRQDYT